MSFAANCSAKQCHQKAGILGAALPESEASDETESVPTLVPSSGENTVHQSEIGSAETLGGNS
jgi:hypothetical protein